MNLSKKAYISLGLFVFLFLFAVSASGVFAQTASSTEVLSSIMGSVIDTVVELITYVVTNYLPYIIVFGLLGIMIGFFVHKAHIGLGTRK